ncbi:hypothetical protein METY_0009 [Methylopila sp. Yamaguchi]|nr:hypothetical protein METY_0009 [Methylopila sp. Yamaguchi]
MARRGPYIMALLSKNTVEGPGVATWAALISTKATKVAKIICLTPGIKWINAYRSRRAR